MQRSDDKQPMYGLTTGEKMPEAFLTDVAVWDAFIGEIWHILLRSLKFTPDASVIDVAPGSSTKLAEALARFGYRGDIYVVDASASALEALKPKYAKLLPEARPRYLCGTLAEEASKLPDRPDYFLGNHILDDMILAGASHQAMERGFAWAQAYTLKPIEDFRREWVVLLGEPERLSASKTRVTGELSAVIRKLRPAYVVLSQYPASSLYDHGLSAVNDQGTEVFERLKTAFAPGLVPRAEIEALMNTVRNFGNAHIGNHVLNPDNWMLCRPNTK
jgi:hypothetical protein